MNRYKACMIILSLCVISTAITAKDKTKEEAISEFKQLPKLTKAEFIKQDFLGVLTTGQTRIYLKRVLKAVMYLDHRIRVLESRSGIFSPLLKEVTSVRDAIKKITGAEKAVVDAQAAAVTETPNASEISTNQD